MRCVVLASIVLALVAPMAEASPGILHVGDSLAVGSDPPLRALLPGWSFTTDALKSRPTRVGVAIIDRQPSLPGAIVVELGTNDDPSQTATFAAQVRHVVSLAGPRRCVVWVNIHRPPFNGVSYAGYNRVLRAAAARSSTLAIVDWDGMVRAGQASVAGDDVHATPSGYQARAKAIAQALSGCSSQSSGTPAGASRTIAPTTRRAQTTPKPRRKRKPKPKVDRTVHAKPFHVYTPARLGTATPEIVTAKAPASSGGTSPWPYIAAGALLALVGGVLVRRRLRAAAN